MQVSDCEFKKSQHERVLSTTRRFWAFALCKRQKRLIQPLTIGLENLIIILLPSSSQHQAIMNSHLSSFFNDQESDSFRVGEESSGSSCDDDYSLKRRYYIRKSRSGKKVKKDKKNPFNVSFWTGQENLLYRQFLIQKGQLFESDKIARKNIKINVQMSQVILTRSPDQCRSHHQKMMKHHFSIRQIIRHLDVLLEQPSQHFPQQNPIDDSPTPTEPSLKDLSTIEEVHHANNSIWNQLIEESHPGDTPLHPLNH